MLYYPSKSSPMNIKAVSGDNHFLSKTVHTTPQIAFKASNESQSENDSDRPLDTPVHSILGMLLPQRILPNTSSLMTLPPILRRPVDSCANHENSFLVFLIRHGEASHNVVEKAATKRAKQQAEAQGLNPGQVKERMEAARVAVLSDESFRDAPLTQQGRRDAEQSRRTLDEILTRHGLTRPGKVLVSPLTRTLETADIIFPDHDAIHVREEVQERKTGKPCDCRQSSKSLSRRRSFQRFQMDSLQKSSFQLDDLYNSDESSSDEDSEQLSPLSLNHSDCVDIFPDSDEEDKEALRLRTQQLFRLLDEPSMAVVTHKGYLRELERGPLGQDDAEEFENGEIRVYRVQLDSDTSVGSVERVV